MPALKYPVVAVLCCCLTAAPAVPLAGPITAPDTLDTALAPAPKLEGVATAPHAVRPARLRFFAIGDVPYSDAEYGQMAALMAGAVRAGTPFIIHVGDIKGGGQPCSDARNSRIAHLFRAQPVPVLYTPGDNEWTDCHRHSAGSLDPLQRLTALRKAFFTDPDVLHRGRLHAVVPERHYPENAYVLRDGVLIALIHVVGSGNNRRPGDGAAMAELAERSRANHALLQRAVAAARLLEARALVVVFHANPALEQPQPPPGYVPLHQDLRMVLKDFGGPVLVIHGDTHHYRFDQPFLDLGSGEPVPRLWRLEVPGSPLVGGVWVDVDTAAAEPFKVDPVYPSALDALEALRAP